MAGNHESDDKAALVRRRIAEAAARAKAEAAARRLAQPEPAAPPEVDGRAGPEPVRYGDWENKGLASDF